MIIQTIPPVLSFTTFCMVSCSFSLDSSPRDAILVEMPSHTNCSTVFPKIFVSQIDAPPSFVSCKYPIKSFACCSVPTIGAISVSMFARMKWIEGLLAFIFTPYLPLCLITSGSLIVISSLPGSATP